MRIRLMFEQSITRRAALERLSAGTLLALGLWPGALRAADDTRSGSFRFIVVNDLHYMTPECGIDNIKVSVPSKTKGTPVLQR